MNAFIESLVEIGRFPEPEDAHDSGLVILSQGCWYWLDYDAEDGCYRLLVEPGKADFLRGQLAIYERESQYWPPENPEMPELHPGSYAAMSWMAALALTYLSQIRWPVLEDWGLASSQAIRGGELYRCFTALFLHNDIGHLTGNLLFGAVFLHLVARHVGTLRAWAGVLFAGTVGNYLNAVLYFGAPHYSLGASTAVFGAIGLLVTLPVGFSFRHARDRLLRVVWIPVIVGLVFLAWFGTGSERTDTSAHLMGFVCGIPAGLLAGLSMRPPGREG